MKSHRSRYLPRSKSHDDGGSVDISAPGTVRGRIARQVGRLPNPSRSPSTSPVREHVPMTPLTGDQTYVVSDSNDSMDDSENVALLPHSDLENDTPCGTEGAPLVNNDGPVKDTCV